MLARRLGLPADINEIFRLLTERWDGKGELKRASGDEIPVSLRIALLAHDATFQRLIGGDKEAIAVIEQRGGHAFDPHISSVFAKNAYELFQPHPAETSLWKIILDIEPSRWLTLEESEVDSALAAIGDFADLISPSLSGHSAGLARLAVSAAKLVGFSDDEITLIRRAAWVHDVGRVAIDTRIWEKPDALTRDEVEQVRLHPYHTERILIQSEFLGTLAPVASNHHEHLDGSGYHRGAVAAMLTRPARLLAVADIYHAMTEPRPHRDPLPTETTATLLQEQVREGHLDPQMVAAVLEAAGQEPVPIKLPKGLTSREVEVLGLLARGLQTKQIATALGISTKTADTHIQNAYRKIGVSTRAAATLFVMETGLVHSGELPILD
jgi:HD-GYP domain-containing protein (c-di-GMP phosphodiesterase class II)